MDASRLKQGLLAFDQRGEFSQDDFLALRAVLGSAMPRSTQAQQILDGLIGVFFERHVLGDTRRAELLAMNDDDLIRAVRHRFRQLLAEDHDDRDAWHALSAHVRDALASLAGPAPSSGFPVSIRANGNFSSLAVDQAVAALWAERGSKPTVSEATAELLQRYVTALAQQQPGGSREFPELMRAQFDVQRLARSVLELLTADERDLLRHVLEGEGSIEQWGVERGVSRATGYRLLSRLKSLCKVEWSERSTGTRLEVLEALRLKLEAD